MPDWLADALAHVLIFLGAASLGHAVGLLILRRVLPPRKK
jgi:hypothetical protein